MTTVFQNTVTNIMLDVLARFSHNAADLLYFVWEAMDKESLPFDKWLDVQIANKEAFRNHVKRLNGTYNSHRELREEIAEQSVITNKDASILNALYAAFFWMDAVSFEIWLAYARENIDVVEAKLDYIKSGKCGEKHLAVLKVVYDELGNKEKYPEFALWVAACFEDEAAFRKSLYQLEK